MLLLLLTFAISTQAIDLRECKRALGMESGAIRDEQIRASSSYNEEYAGPQHGRAGVESGSGAWCPAGQITASSKEFIEIDLLSPTLLTGIKTMGRYDEGRGNEFARFYRVEYWRSEVGEWRKLITGDLQEILPGNTDTRSPHTSWIDGGVVVERARIFPVSNTTRTICMRTELYGCPYRDSLTSYSLLDGTLIDGLDLRDSRYDGRRDGEGRVLEGGLGKLYDGLLGFEDHESHPERWVGWKREEEEIKDQEIEIVAHFKKAINISGVLLHTSNYRRYNAQIFSSITLHFSSTGLGFSPRSLTHPYQEDGYENLRWVRVPVPNRIAKTVKITLTLPPSPYWLLLSELQFETEDEPAAAAAAAVTTTLGEQEPEAVQSQSNSVILMGILAGIVLLGVVVWAVCTRRQRGVKSSTPPLSSNLFASHHVMMEDGTMKTIVSPSMYAMARDNRTNELIEKIPLHYDDDTDTIYAEPDSLDEDLCSSQIYKAPLLCSSTATTLSMRKGTLPSKPLIPSSLASSHPMDCSVYSTLLPSIARSQLEFIRTIGKGEFGTVNLSRLDRRRLVALKSLHKRDRTAETALEKEVRVMGGLKHPNIVEVIGMVPAEGEAPMCCVMQFMPRGDLKKYLTTKDVDPSTVFSFCVQIAAGMSYLESRSYVHRDLAARNCLLDDDLSVRIGDFGMARSLYSDEYYTVEGECRLPVRWMAPESMLMGKFSSSSDVWSFAVTCWEIMHRCERLPYDTLTHAQVVDRLTKGESGFLECPTRCPEWMYREMMLPCWNIDPELRPTFQAIHHYMQSAQQKMLS